MNWVGGTSPGSLIIRLGFIYYPPEPRLNMEFVKTRNLGGHSYFLSDPECFFFRHADSGFKTKWTGLWHRELKFLEFFAVKAGGKWLSERTCRKFTYNGREAVHEFRTPKGKVIQRLKLDRLNRLSLEIESSREMDIEVELAVSIRRRVENLTNRAYSTARKGQHLLVSNELGSLSVAGPKGMGFQPREEYREHAPSGDPASYFMAGTLRAKGRNLRFTFTPLIKGEQPPRASSVRPPSIQNMIKSSSKFLEEGFRWSALGAEFCRKNSPGGVGWYAGLPWFQQFWGRDQFWVLPGLTALGYFEDVRACLHLFAKNAEQGRIPNLVSETEGRLLNSIDATPLWMISLEDYVRASGDTATLRKLGPGVEASVRFLLDSDSDRDGFIEHDSGASETWMDTLKREKSAVEIQGLFHQALGSARELLRLSKSSNSNLIQEIEAREDLLGWRFSRDYYLNGYLGDRITNQGLDTTRTSNALVPLLGELMGHDREVLRVIESREFTSPKGVRSRAMGEVGFDPKGYHTGSVWSLTTAWACAAEFRAGRSEKAWKFLQILLDDLGHDALGCIGECWDGHGSLAGCHLQLWGSAFIPRLVDEFMLGIRIDSIGRRIEVSPRLPKAVKSIERTRRTGLGPVTLKFSSSGVKCSNRKFRLENR